MTDVLSDAEVEKLRSVVDEASPPIVHALLATLDAALADVERTERENERLREALRKHGRHTEACRYQFDHTDRCVCGLAAALAPAPPVPEEGATSG